MAETDKDDLISIIDEDEKDAVIPDTLPLISVRDIVIFTDMLLPLFIGREKSIRAIEEAVEKDGYLFLTAQKDPNIENPNPDQIFTVGTVSKILRMLKLPDGRVKALVQGIEKARIVKYVSKRSIYRVKIDMIPDLPVENINIEMEALMRNVIEHSEKILALRGEMNNDVGVILESVNDPGKLGRSCGFKSEVKN